MQCLQRLPRFGSIPAHAGEPMQKTMQYFMNMVYPRACGGTIRQILKGENDMGLSPRMRGNLVRMQARDHFFGSIPAHAGEP